MCSEASLTRDHPTPAEILKAQTSVKQISWQAARCPYIFQQQIISKEEFSRKSSTGFVFTGNCIELLSGQKASISIQFFFSAVIQTCITSLLTCDSSKTLTKVIFTKMYSIALYSLMHMPRLPTSRHQSYH